MSALDCSSLWMSSNSIINWARHLACHVISKRKSSPLLQHAHKHSHTPSVCLIINEVTQHNWKYKWDLGPCLTARLDSQRPSPSLRACALRSPTKHLLVTVDSNIMESVFASLPAQHLQKAADVALQNSVCVFYIKNAAGHLTGSVAGTAPVPNTLTEHIASVSWCARVASRHTSADILPCPFLAHYHQRWRRDSKPTNYPQLKTAILSPVCPLFHLVVGVLDDSVEGWHQGLLLMKAASIGRDVGLW